MKARTSLGLGCCSSLCCVPRAIGERAAKLFLALIFVFWLYSPPPVTAQDFNTKLAGKLAVRAEAFQESGELVKAFLLYSEAARRDSSNQEYWQRRDSIAAAAKLLMRARLEEADISNELTEAEQEVKREEVDAVLVAATRSVPHSVPREIHDGMPEPEPAPSDEATSQPVDDKAVPVENKPSRLNLSLSMLQTAALSAHKPMRLTENRTYFYLEGKTDLWTSASQQYRLELSEEVRAFYDSVFATSHLYPEIVRSNEGHQVDIRKLLLNFSAPSWTIHAGRQQVTWGEAVGVFIADVVNPKDYRQFLVPDFDDIRIPLWSVDARKTFGNAGTLELFLSPDVRTSELPVPGSEFTFYTPPSSVPSITSYSRPPRTLGNSSLGLRYTLLKNGWDSSIFYLRSIDDLPATSTGSNTNPNPFLNIEQQYPLLDHYAATTSKPLGDFVLKAEAIYTTGTQYQTLSLGPALSRRTVSGMIGVSYPLRDQYLLDVQYFQTSLFGNTANLYQPGLRTGVSIRIADVASLRRVKPSIQIVGSPNQHDFWISPRINVRLADSLFATAGVDWFSGTLETLFGQFRDASRFELSLLWKAK